MSNRRSPPPSPEERFIGKALALRIHDDGVRTETFQILRQPEFRFSRSARRWDKEPKNDRKIYQRDEGPILQNHAGFEFHSPAMTFRPSNVPAQTGGQARDCLPQPPRGPPGPHPSLRAPAGFHTRTPLMPLPVPSSASTGVVRKIKTSLFFNAFTKWTISAGPLARMRFFLRCSITALSQLWWFATLAHREISSTVRALDRRSDHEFLFRISASSSEIGWNASAHSERHRGAMG